jgi:hypothetical protein
MASPFVKLREEWGEKRMRLLWLNNYETEMKNPLQVTYPYRNQGNRH